MPETYARILRTSDPAAHGWVDTVDVEEVDA